MTFFHKSVWTKFTFLSHTLRAVLCPGRFLLLILCAKKTDKGCFLFWLMELPIQAGSTTAASPQLPSMVPLHWSHNLYSTGFVPICSLGLSQIGRMNLGTDASTFKFYTMCGLQEGFEPFAVNMNRDVAVWFSKRLPTFVNVPKDHPHIEVTLHHGWSLQGK